MHRRWVTLISFSIALIGGAYVGSPYWAAHSLKEAVLQGDADKIDAATDMAAVREGLKSQLSTALLRKMNTDAEIKDSPFAKALGTLIMPMIIDKVIDSYVTPDGLVTVLRGGNPTSPQSDTQAKSPAVMGDTEYIGLDRFRVKLREAQSEDQGPSLLFERRGVFEWKLIRIELPDNMFKDLSNTPSESSPSPVASPDIAATAAPEPAPIVSAAPHELDAAVAVKGGNIVYRGADGAEHQITKGGMYSDPVISPDGTLIAFIHQDAPADDPDDVQDGPKNSIWVYDIPKGEARLVMDQRPSRETDDGFRSPSHPVFSLDGHFIYVMGPRWATSGAIYQISLSNWKARLVTSGNSLAVIRNGPYRGYLLAQQHNYWPKGGSYNPTYVIRPDGVPAFMVPGTQIDDDTDRVAPWLRKNGWQAW